MNRDLFRQLLCIVSVVGTIVGNVLANALPFNGQTTGAVSNRFDVYFVPAGYVFGIWGLLYLAWCVLAVYQALPGQRANPRLRSAVWPFILGGPVNVLWLLLWHYEQFLLTVIVMLTLLALLIVAYVRLDIGRSRPSVAERVCVQVPISLYLAWISVATIANITIFLSHVGWGGWGFPETGWAALMILVATLLGAVACLQRRDYAFIAVLAWAFIGIAQKQAGAPPVYTTAWIATALLGVIVVLRLVQDFRSPATPATS